MEDDKIKIKDIEGSKDVVLDFIKESGTDIPSLLSVEKEVKIPFLCIVILSIIFVTMVIMLAIIPFSELVFKALSLLSIAIGVVLVSIVYMAYKSKTLAGIVAFGEVILLSISLGVYSPKEAVEKIGNKIEKIVGD